MPPYVSLSPEYPVSTDRSQPATHSIETASAAAAHPLQSFMPVSCVCSQLDHHEAL
jgi:hypothetical protein